MPSPVVHAGELLYDGIIAQLTDDFAPAPCPISFGFGFRETARQDNEGAAGANRIICVPGDTGGRFARDLPPRNPGRDPRSLGTKDEYFTYVIWAADASDLTDERLQYRAVRYLYDGWYRALYLVTHTDGDVGIGPVSIVDESWDNDHILRGYGFALVVVVAVQAMVPDEKFSLVEDVGAAVAVTVQGQLSVVNE